MIDWLEKYNLDLSLNITALILIVVGVLWDNIFFVVIGFILMLVLPILIIIEYSKLNKTFSKWILGFLTIGSYLFTWIFESYSFEFNLFAFIFVVSIFLWGALVINDLSTRKK